MSHMHSSSPHSCYMPCPSQPPELDHSNCTWKRVQVWSSSLCGFLQPPVTSSLFGPNILLNILFSNTLSLCCDVVFRLFCASLLAFVPHFSRPFLLPHSPPPAPVYIVRLLEKWLGLWQRYSEHLSASKFGMICFWLEQSCTGKHSTFLLVSSSSFTFMYWSVLVYM
jgi:hypothetical protein